MKLIINGTVQDVAATTLDALLSELNKSARVATAVNETFVPAADRDKTRLSEGDRVEILAPMQGG
jgi:sulfur carrier protein